MKDIGYSFKVAREKIGITREEAAKDLEITEAQLDNLEDGNANAFKDVFFLKEIVKKYAKYLNINEDEIIDEFNDFVFNFTSRIPLSEIEEKMKEKTHDEVVESPNKISSPYTNKKEQKKKLNPIIVYIISIFILVMIVIFVVNIIKDSVNKRNQSINANNLIERSMN